MQVPKQFRTRLLKWFDAHRRELPWRVSRDPYAIWISEVMLQQTTVAAVIPYFERFLKAFPNVAALANAQEADVLKLWEGLGYYRRARHLHAAAKQLHAAYPDELPDDIEVWQALPGVGRYILGAVLSQAFDARLPIVEANIQRVLPRVFGLRDDPRTGTGRAQVWELAEAVLPQKRIGDFNQALMELGSLVCTPKKPKCNECPLKSMCIANRDGLQESIPPKPIAKAKREVREACFVISQRGKVLICQRPATATRWASMWEFPHAEEQDDLVALARTLTGFTVQLGEVLRTITHTVTTNKITLTFHAAEKLDGLFIPGAYAASRWVTAKQLLDFPVSAPQRKFMNEWSAEAEE